MLKKILIYHIIPLLFSIAVSFGVVFHSPAKKHFIKYDSLPSVKIYPDTVIKSFGNFEGGYRSEITMRNALKNENAIVVIGSSEMSVNTIAAIPYNFFTEHKIACIGYGHEGNQGLSILTQLAVMHKELYNAKVVVILYPGWYEGGSVNGTSLQSFMEFVNERLQYLFYYDEAIPADVKEYVYDYIVKNYKNIDSPSAILKLMYYTGLSNQSAVHKLAYSPFCFLYKNVCAYKMQKMTALYKDNLSLQPYTDEKYPFVKLKTEGQLHINWDSLRTKAKATFDSASTSNSVGIEDSYYNKWMKGGGKKSISPVDAKRNTEFRDFCMLLKLLDDFQCKPYFIIQPLNPLVYKNMHDIDPILNNIKEEIKK